MSPYMPIRDKGVRNDGLKELAHVIDRRKAETLLDILKGIWVQAEAAANLIEARERNEPVAINCTELENFTGWCYARRAWPFPQLIRPISAGASRNFDQIKTVILSEAGKTLDSKRAEQRLRQIRDPILLMFPPPEPDDIQNATAAFPDKLLLDEIRQAYPNVTILLATGHEIPDTLQHVMPLRPPLTGGEEGTQYGYYLDSIDYIEKQMR